MFQVCKLYNRWKINNKVNEVLDTLDETSLGEFGTDDYIQAKSSYAESLMLIGETEEAIDKFLAVKKQIEDEIIYENPTLYLNVCNMLGNCYL